MATFNMTFVRINNRTTGGKVAEVAQGNGALRCTALTTSGTAGTVQRGGSDFEAPSDGYVKAHADGAVIMAVGETASATVGHEVFSGETYWCSIAEGETVSVIDA